MRLQYQNLRVRMAGTLSLIPNASVQKGGRDEH